MTTPDHTAFSIFLWHHAADREFAKQLAGKLRSRGYETISMGEIEERDEPSFTLDWQMAESDCVLFLISQATLESPSLTTDAEKVLRRKDALLIPAYLEPIRTDELPLLLQYIQPVAFYQNDAKAVEHLLAL